MSGTTTTREPSPNPEPAAPITQLARDEHTVEIVSDGGEGAQKCGQIFGAVSARMGNGVWTVEIIPAEIQPPPRTLDGASGNRIRIGRGPVTNWGDAADLVIAFNEQALLARHRLGALAKDAVILIENMWKTHDDPKIREQWAAAMDELSGQRYRVLEVPMEDLCLEVVDNARRGKNMLALGILAWIYDRDLGLIEKQIAQQFRKKSEEIYERNVKLLHAGAEWAAGHLDFRIAVEPRPSDVDMVVMNGNQALGMGAIAAGMDFLAMYPITPATSVTHYLSEVFDQAGGIVHQAEDEIAAVGAAIGASYAGKVAFTITSGPGLALKTEFINLAVMTETPLVLVDVQRGGPSTGLPTKVEQSDLLACLFGQPGDAPKVVMAPATIEDCFHVMVTARRIAEAFRCVVVVLTDANLATGVQPFERPKPDARWLARDPEQAPVVGAAKPYDWDPQTGLSTRIIPGQPGGMHTCTGLNHDERSKVSYAPSVNQQGCTMRSRRLAVLQDCLSPAPVHGDDEGDLVVVGWGSTKGAIEEAVDRARAAGHRVSSVHLSVLSPLPPRLKETLSRFRRVMTVEINYSDDLGQPYINAENRRLGQLCFLLRGQLLVDADCWTRVIGQPLRPGQILAAITERLGVEDGR